MSRVRFLVAALAMIVCVVLQVSFFPYLSWNGVVPNLGLLVVVGAAFVLPAPQALVLGFVGGLALDLAPPADHLAGRWALALTVVAFLVARARQDVKPTALAVVGTVAAASFIGTSLYALSGAVLQDPALGVVELLQVVLVALVWDVLLTPFVLPLLMKSLVRLGPQWVSA